MDPRLRKLGASSMADIDRHFANHDPATIQIDVDKSARLVDAVAIHARMQAGVRDEDRIQVFNPERVLRKVEAEQAMRAAIGEMDASIDTVTAQIQQTRDRIRNLESLLALGAGQVAVGPSINQRALDKEQVIYPTQVEMPDEDPAAPGRRISKKQKFNLRRADAESQVTFWRANLAVLQEKEAALFVYRNALITSRDQFSTSVLKLPTRIGCGYSDFTFHY